MSTPTPPLTPPSDPSTPAAAAAAALPVIHDILIIGAGPAGLAVAARLSERTPSALFTDEEHRRYHWIRKTGALPSKGWKFAPAALSNPKSAAFTKVKGNSTGAGAAKPKGWVDGGKGRNMHTGHGRHDPGELTPPSSPSPNADADADAHVHGKHVHSSHNNLHRSASAETSQRENEEDKDQEQEKEKEVGQRLGRYTTLVLDGTGPRFLSRWHTLFKLFSIPHLRSPMFFHIDPSDRDGLLAYAFESSSYEQCIEIPGVVGKELSKHEKKRRREGRGCGNSLNLVAEKGRRKSSTSAAAAARGDANGLDDSNTSATARSPAARRPRVGAGRAQEGRVVRIDERDRKDYLTPSTTLFQSHCDEVIRRYAIDESSLIQQENVHDVRYGCAAELLPELRERAHEDVFCVATNKGMHYARVVVLASGPPMRPIKEPKWSREACAHSSAIAQQGYPVQSVRERIARGAWTEIVIVGGGLTSAQLADLALKRGVKKVWLVMRSGVKIKPFDVDLAWLGKFKNREKATFWSADTDEERLEMIREARNGGSIPAGYVKLLKAWERQGRLEIVTQTSVKDIKAAESEPGRWKVETQPSIKELGAVDYVYFATGPTGLAALDREAAACPVFGDGDGPEVMTPLPFLQSLQREHPIRWLKGLPALNDDLAWSDDVPLFVTGALAALRLGPGAPNLEGARIGAERVAWGIEDVLPLDGKGDGDDEVDDRQDAYLEGRGGQYASLMALDGNE